MAELAPALGKRLLFVMGKGGVGKSTVAAALGTLAAGRGLRTIVAEVALRHDISRALGTPADAASETEVELRPGLFWISIDPHLAMQEYLVDQLRVRALAEVLSASRAFNYLAAAAPGLQELLTVGKLWELAQRERRIPGSEPYDLVVVDAPATGHGLAYLTTPGTFADIARAGPIARQARTIHEMLTDGRQTGVIAVATPHELPVTEALFLHRELRRQMGLDLDRVVVNALAPARFSPRELERLRAALGPGEATPSREPEPSDRWTPVQAGIAAALSEAEQARDQRRQVDRLRRGTGRPPAPLPFVYSSALGPEQLALLASRLDGAL
jgi:anion-transporting  ArsA/GET3 family ATPase